MLVSSLTPSHACATDSRTLYCIPYSDQGRRGTWPDRARMEHKEQDTDGSMGHSLRQSPASRETVEWPKSRGEKTAESCVRLPQHETSAHLRSVLRKFQGCEGDMDSATAAPAPRSAGLGGVPQRGLLSASAKCPKSGAQYQSILVLARRRWLRGDVTIEVRA